MSKRSDFAMVIALLLVITPTSAQTISSGSFKVEISIEQGSLEDNFYKTFGGFVVATKIINSSGRDQQITVWTQYGWSWLSDNGELSPSVETGKNSQDQIILKPNQEYASSLRMWSDVHKEVGPRTFRLGFVPNAKLPAISNKDKVDNWGGIFWSNQVILSK